jgi:hypothetical protein
MEKAYRVIVECYDKNSPKEVLSQCSVLEGDINKPTNCMDFTIGIEKQISLLQNVQDYVLLEKTLLLNQEEKNCPNCTIKLAKFGKHNSTIHDVFTDHKVQIQRLKCNKCKYEVPSTVRTILNGTLTGDLVKIQASLGSDHTYRESEKLLTIFSQKERQVNNHDRVKQVVESVGKVIEQMNKDEKEIITAKPASELILNVDGGHIKTVEDKRSIEAMVSVIYRPEALEANKKGTRNYLESKNCAASIKDDGQKQMVSSTIIAALKQGLNEKTHITALCDGADNCWKIAESLAPICGKITYILDWFHMSMKIKNIALPEILKSKLVRIKWHLWRGNVERALIRLNELEILATNQKEKDKISKFAAYTKNNKNRIIDYRKRKNEGLVFTSNLAESTVESLINRRCKGQQHMRWSREGLNPLLQLRAAIHSDEWADKWRTAVLSAAA